MRWTAVGNTRWYAGGLMITPDAEVDVGLLADGGGLALDLRASGERVGALSAIVTVDPKALHVPAPRPRTDRGTT
jgi:hypothetical protein